MGKIWIDADTEYDNEKNVTTRRRKVRQQFALAVIICLLWLASSAGFGQLLSLWNAARNEESGAFIFLITKVRPRANCEPSILSKGSRRHRMEQMGTRTITTTSVCTIVHCNDSLKYELTHVHSIDRKVSMAEL